MKITTLAEFFQPQAQVTDAVHFQPQVPATDSPLLWGNYIVGQVPCLREALEACMLEEGLAATIQEYDAALQEATDYPRPSAKQKVRLALEVALLSHHGQARRSGEPYIIHPVAVAVILGGTQMDRDTICAGLLHDTVEDTALAFEDLEVLFGSTVRRLVEGETKVSKIPKMVSAGLDPADTQAENLRSMFIAMADDWRIVVVKLADRLHNMRTLQFMPVEKRVRIAQETLEIFSPLAHRMGLWQYKTELADLSFSYLFPNEFHALSATVTSRLLSYQNTLASAKAQLEGELQADEWLHGRMRSVQVTGRTKSVYSTWKKMQRLNCGIDGVNDLVALRVVLNPEEDERLSLMSTPLGTQQRDVEEKSLCYHVLGKVHGLYTPLPRTLKDYISSPKPNGYASLHTTVMVGSQVGRPPARPPTRPLARALAPPLARRRHHPPHHHLRTATTSAM